MRVFITKPADKIEEQRKAREVIAALKDFGFEFAGVAGEDFFDVRFPKHVDRGAAQHFLDGVGARAVTVQPGDAVALVNPGLEARGVDELIKSKLVVTDCIPIEHLSADVQNWRDSLWVDTVTLDAAEEQRIYDAVMREMEPPGFLEQVRPAHRDSISRMSEESEAELQTELSKLRAQ